ncbi:MAG: helix-turn-helix transcriptional regulator [Solimonas sp.]
MARLLPLPPDAIARSPVGLRLRQLRMQAGLSQAELGIRIGIHPDVASSRMNQYERGGKEPAFSIVRLIARELGVPAAFFYAESDALAELIRGFAEPEAHPARARRGKTAKG